MILYRRKHGSQRPMKPVKLELFRNVAPDGIDLTFKGEDDIWYSISLETFEEMKTLLSEAHIIHHNWPES